MIERVHPCPLGKELYESPPGGKQQSISFPGRQFPAYLISETNRHLKLALMLLFIAGARSTYSESYLNLLKAMAFNSKGLVLF